MHRTDPFDEEAAKLRHLYNATDVLEMASWVLPSIERLKDAMEKGQHRDPRVALMMKKSVDGLLDTLTKVCDRRGVNFAEVLAYLSPIEDLLVELSRAALEKKAAAAGAPGAEDRSGGI